MLKKVIALLALASVATSVFVVIEVMALLRTMHAVETVQLRNAAAIEFAPLVAAGEPSVGYNVFVDNVRVQQFDDFESARAFAETQTNAAIARVRQTTWIWDNFPPFVVFIGHEKYAAFETFAEAVHAVREKRNSFIFYRKNNNLIWSKTIPKPYAKRIEGVPLILQRPLLPRGCEVTSLAMLLQFYGLDVDKMTLAHQIAKDPTPRVIQNGRIYAGNPNVGFVGDMFDMSNHGYGVYHKPIHALLTEYFPNAALDLTGCDFSDILRFVGKGRPVWVVINTRYRHLPESAFHTWHTADGPIRITYHMHAVVITGYDSRYVYFNDPFGVATHARRADFAAAWVQMGSQAVAIGE